MLHLDTNYCLFLKILSERLEISSITAMANAAGLSRRMIYYYTEKLDTMLRHVKLPPVYRKTGGGLVINTEQADQIKDWLAESETHQYTLKTSERRQVLELLILLELRKWFLRDFMEIFDVSRNTIVKDIASLKESREVLSNKARGYFLDMSERERRTQIYQVIHRMGEGGQEQTFAFLARVVALDCAQLADLEAALRQTEQILNKEISGNDVKRLAQAMLLFARRSDAGKHPEWQISERIVIMERLEYRAADTMLSVVSQVFQQPVPQEEALYYGMLLLCVEKNVDGHFKSSPFEELVQLTETMVTIFEQISGIYFKLRYRLVENIQTHIKVIHYRHVFQIKIHPPVLHEISKQYQKVFRLTEKMVQTLSPNWLFQKYFAHGLTKQEIAGIALFFEEAIVKEQSKKAPAKWIIVSDYADVLNSLLATQIKQLLPEMVLEGIFSTGMAPFLNQKINFCVTTDMQYIHTTGQTIYVGAVLSEEDKRRLFNIKKSPDKVMGRRDKLRKLLYNSSSNGAPDERLLDQVELLYTDEDRAVVHSDLVTLADFRKEELFFEEEQVESLTDVLSLLAKPLLDRKWIRTEYMEQIAHDVMEDKRLMILFQGVILLHTDYRNGSFQPGISMLHVKEPFCIHGESVNLFILLATEEKMTHVPLLFELDVLLNSSFLANLENGVKLFEAFQMSVGR
ncbi:BglG family transcription antiterminator [Listeria booriae]|uniref:BglG family transcription antiterminator n=1 Tax=Listeria booriae TaxID=1552123 RepID=UPI001628E917|nr:PRD domain-containing protein [Listeria booriae]MBC2023731.1 PRD domain-containing protein [Listeria booriae]MBC2068539.1 PRD domain-containing protein [Listeria booriae]